MHDEKIVIVTSKKCLVTSLYDTKCLIIMIHQIMCQIVRSEGTDVFSIQSETQRETVRLIGIDEKIFSDFVGNSEKSMLSIVTGRF